MKIEIKAIVTVTVTYPDGRKVVEMIHADQTRHTEKVGNAEVSIPINIKVTAPETEKEEKPKFRMF